MIGALFESIGIGLVLPVFTIISNSKVYLLSNEAFTSTFPNFIIQLVISTSQETLIYFSLFILVTSYLVKNIYLSISHFFAYNIIYQLQINISNNLFLKYLKSNYNFFLNSNKANLVRNINDEVGTFIRRLLVPLALMISEILTIIFITSVLIIVNFYASITALIFGFLFGLIIIFFTKKKIKIWGIERQLFSGKKYKNLYESFNSIIDIKLKNLEKFFLEIFKKNNSKNIKADRNVDLLNLMPRFLLEFFGIFIFCVIFLILFELSYKVENILPILALYAAAAFRLLPSINRVLVYYNSFLYGYKAFEKIDEEFNFKYKKFNLDIHSNKSDKIIETFDSISLQDVTFSYKERTILKNINLKIVCGEYLGITGSSGSGKSTLILLIAGLLKPSSGTIRIDNFNYWEQTISLNKIFGYVPQKTTLIDDTIRKNIAFGQSEEEINDNKIDYVVNFCQLKDFVNNSEQKLNTIIGDDGLKISGGQRQRLALARALYFDPKILILDEATSALDELTENKILDIVYRLKGKITLIFISHKKTNLKICDKIYDVKNMGIDLI